MMIPGIPYYKSEIPLFVASEKFFTKLKGVTSRYSENPIDNSETPVEPAFEGSESDYIANAPFVGKVTANSFRIRRRPKFREIPPIAIGRMSSSGNTIQLTVFVHPAEVILDIVLCFLIIALWRSQFGSFGVGGILTLIALYLLWFFTVFMAEAKKVDEALRGIGSQNEVQHGRRH